MGEQDAVEHLVDERARVVDQLLHGARHLPPYPQHMTLPTPDRQAEFLATTPNVTVATIRPDGLPQLTPNWFLWTGDVFWISTAAATVKTRNLRRIRGSCCAWTTCRAAITSR